MTSDGCLKTRTPAPSICSRGAEREGDDCLSVLHVTAPAPVGGLERVVEALATGHRERGHRVRVLAVLEPGQEREHPFVVRLEGQDVDVRSLSVGRRAYLSEQRLLAREFREFGPDVVHTHGHRSDVVDGIVAKVLGLPLVTTSHGGSATRPVGRFYEWLQEVSYRWFDAVAAVSSPLLESAASRGVSRDRLHLVPNGWPDQATRLTRPGARKRLGLDPESYVIGWVGRLIDAKGPDLFLRALSRLDEFQFSASIIGDGRQMEALEQLASSLELRDRVKFHGYVDEAAALYEAFDLFVVSSRREGTPMALFEAMGAGVPVVAFRVGGVPDVVSPEEADLVENGNIEALAEGIRRAFNDPTSAARRAREAARTLESKYGLEAWLSRYEEIYRTAIQRALSS